MKTPLLMITLVALGVASTAASALDHDSLAEFYSISAVQGKATTTTSPVQFTSVSANRSNWANMFDGNLGTAYSLGLGGTQDGNTGGTLQLVILPTTNVITSGSLIEWTNTGSGHRESAIVSLGVDGGNYIQIGELSNSQFGGPAFVTIFNNQSAASLSVSVASTNHTTFSLNVLSGSFNSVRFEDTSPFTLGSGGTANRDGFDIAELKITSAVPEPTALALAGAAMFVLGAARRRNKARR